MIPNFEGRDSFKGRSWHTAEWPADRPRSLVQGQRLVASGRVILIQILVTVSSTCEIVANILLSPTSRTL